VLTVVGAFGSAAASLHATEPTATDRTLAAALFKEGKALMDKGDLASACMKLEESQRLESGLGTLLNLAVCHEKEGKNATAWAEFMEARGLARQANRQSRIDLAEEHIARLEKSLSRLTIDVPSEADEPALEITCDGAAIARAAWGMAVPIDPGDHRVQAVAPNKTPFSSTINVPGESPTTLTVHIPPLVAAVPVSASTVVAPMPVAATSSSAASAGQPSPATRSPVSTPAPEPDRTSAQRVWAWGAIGLGGAGLVTGTALSVLALNKKSESHDRCPHDPCDAEAVSLGHDAARFADFATVGFGVGFAALATGVILLLTDGSGGTRAAATRTWEVYPQARTGTRGEAGIGLKGLF
jgi:serine/threonine-protein kinase